VSSSTGVRSRPLPRSEPQQNGPSVRRLDIQGLRAIAVGGVLLYHGHISFVRGGYAGVDMFFVISGFLITSQLLRSLRTSGRISLADFYARRARRILPASFAVLIVTAIVGWLVVSPLLGYTVLRDAIATALYVPNYLFAVQGTDYLHQTAAPSLFQHYWSLGVEEQFYLVWPVLLLVVFVFARRSWRALAATMLVVFALSLAACLWLTVANQPWAFFSLPTRAWEFGAGGILGLAIERGWLRMPPLGAAVMAWLGLVGLALIMFRLSDDLPFPGWVALAPVIATGAVIVGDHRGGAGSPARLLSLGPVVFLGEISYSLYLVHWPILTLPFEAQSAGGFAVSRVGQFVLIAACVPLAWLSYRFVETPFRTGRRIVALHPRRTLLTAAVGSAVVTLALMGTSGAVARVPLNADRAAPVVSPSMSVEGTSYVPSNITPSLRAAAATVLLPAGCEIADYADATPHACYFGAIADAPVVVLFGDSHASEWYPALRTLADSGRIRLVSYTKSGCPAAAVGVTWQGQPYPECTQWRDAVIARLSRTHPSLVLLGSYQGDHNSGDIEAWRAGVVQTVNELSFTSAALLLDTPGPAADVPTCLSGHLQDTADCAVTRDSDFERLETSSAAMAGVPWIGVNDYLCEGNSCPAVIGNTLVYRDGSHITAAMSAQLGPVVASQVERLLPSTEK
jgi:peptidoglycan/LPS O-acetylase OafA/YrhL